MRRWPRLLPWLDQPATRLVLGQHVGPGAGLPFAARPVVLRDGEIHQHKHVIGLTGQGKSKLLVSLFVQLHNQGIGCDLIDPHSDLALDCLRLLAEDGRLERPEDCARLCYVDLGRRDAYLPFNILVGGRDDPHAVARRLVEVCREHPAARRRRSGREWHTASRFWNAY